MASIFTAVDLTSIEAFVVAGGLIVVAVALAYKAGVLGKRTIKAV